MIHICKVCDKRAGGLVSKDRPMEQWPEPDLCPECGAKKAGEMFAQAMADQELRKAANRLHHFSMRYGAAFLEMATGKSQGLIPSGYPGLQEFRDIVDIVLFCRAEISGHTRILMEAGLITNEKATKIMAEEYEWLAQAKAKQFGIGVSDAGLVFTKESK